MRKVIRRVVFQAHVERTGLQLLRDELDELVLDALQFH